MYRSFTTLKTREEKDVEELEEKEKVEKKMVGRINKFFEFIKELIGVKKRVKTVWIVTWSLIINKIL